MRGHGLMWMLIFCGWIAPLIPCGVGAAVPGKGGDAALDRVADLFAKGYQLQTGGERKQDLKQALLYYRKALKGYPAGYPEPFAVLYNSGLIYAQLKQNRNAQRYFIRAARAAQKLPEVRPGGDIARTAARLQALARNGLGTCYQRDGRMKAAEKQYRAAIQLDPELVEAHFNLLNLLSEQQRWDEMDQALAVAREAAPSSRYEFFEGRRAGKEGFKGHRLFSGMLGVGVTAAVLSVYFVVVRARRRRSL